MLIENNEILTALKGNRKTMFFIFTIRWRQTLVFNMKSSVYKYHKKLFIDLMLSLVSASLLNAQFAKKKIWRVSVILYPLKVLDNLGFYQL